MRTSILLAALVAVLGLASGAQAQEPIPYGAPLSDYSVGGGYEGAYDSGCCHGHRLHRCRPFPGKACLHNRRNYEGLDMGFNCGCGGSYKFPVPPQYTYFWPGSTYSQGLMTNYHSPWRFPPLKPYTEETLTPISVDDAPLNGLQPATALQRVDNGPQLPPGQIEPMSSAMQRFFR